MTAVSHSCEGLPLQVRPCSMSLVLRKGPCRSAGNDLQQGTMCGGWGVGCGVGAGGGVRRAKCGGRGVEGRARGVEGGVWGAGCEG